jgi:mannitol-specific phosphotransferase system IIBC component
MPAVQGSEVKKVIIACEAGMGSSVLLVTQMKKRLGNYGIAVDHSPVNQIPDDADVVLCHQGLSARARQRVGEVPVLAFNTYLGDPVFDRLEEAVKNDDAIES